MRLVLSAVVAVLLISEAVLAGQDDEIQSDLVVVTAMPRPADVKMVAQTAAPSAKPPAQQPVKTASK